MKNFIKKHDIPLRLLCLILSLTLWAVVQITTNPERTPEIREIPINIEGAQELLEQYNLSIIDGAESTVTLRIKGKLSDVAAAKNSDFSVMVDVSKIRQAGEQRLKYTVSKTNPDIMILDRQPATVTLFVDELGDKQVPVSVAVEGKPSEGYSYNEAVCDYQSVRVSGPKTELEKISAARVSIRADGVTEDVVQNSTVILLDQDGKEFKSPYVKIETQFMDVNLSVTQQRTVPLRVTVNGAEGLTADTATVTISPQTITVSGPVSLVSALTEVNLGTINLSVALDGQKMEMPIILPSGVSLAEGQPNTATVEIAIKNLAQWQVAVSQVNITQTASDKYLFQVLQDQIEVSVRGLPEAADNFSELNLRAEAVVDVDTLGPGTHEIPVTVSVVDNENVRVLSYEPQTVTVMIYDREEDR